MVTQDTREETLALRLGRQLGGEHLTELMQVMRATRSSAHQNFRHWTNLLGETVFDSFQHLGVP